MEKIKVVSFGGGGGQSQILSGIKNIDFIDITALCTASDSGGSTGIMRKEYGVGGYLGDVSKCLWALSDKKKIENTLMHRFEKGFLKGHSMRNILYSALIEIHGEKEALDKARNKIQAAIVGIFVLVLILTIFWTIEQVVFKKAICFSSFSGSQISSSSRKAMQGL